MKNLFLKKKEGKYPDKRNGYTNKRQTSFIL